MWFSMRKVGLDFLDTAEKVYVVEHDLAASRREVWDAFVDAGTWHRWWPGLESASYGEAAPPHGVGTFRESTVSGQRFEETMVAWDEGRRWAYIIDRTTLPIATAQLECTEFSDHGSGTRVRWILAQDPRLPMRLLGPLFPRTMATIFRSAMTNLDALLAARRTPTA